MVKILTKRNVFNFFVEFLIIGIACVFFLIDLIPNIQIPPNVFLEKLGLFVLYCMGYGMFIKLLRGHIDIIVQILYCKRHRIVIRTCIFHPFIKEHKKKIEFLRFLDYFDSNLDVSIQNDINDGMSFYFIYKEKNK